MTAITTNPVDWALAILCGIPLLMAAVAYIAVWAEERVDHVRGTHDTSLGVVDGLPESTASHTGRR